jgi:type II secretion system protein I
MLLPIIKARTLRMPKMAVMNFQKKSAGFTLLEILVALIIFSIGILALTSLTVTATRTGSYGGRMTEAVTFAQDKLEELKTNSWEKIVSGTDQETGPTGITYTRNWKVLEKETRNLKTVSIRIDWNDPAHHSISLFTVISQ